MNDMGVHKRQYDEADKNKVKESEMKEKVGSQAAVVLPVTPPAPAPASVPSGPVPPLPPPPPPSLFTTNTTKAQRTSTQFMRKTL